MPMLSPPHPGFFGVLASRRAYTTLLYLLLSMATGIFAFTFAVTGLSLSLGLAILILGIPVMAAFLGGTRLLSVGELHLLKALVGAEGSEAPHLLPRGEGFWARLKALVADPRTWTSLLYFLLLLPLGILYFTLMVTSLSVSLSLLLAPFARLFEAMGWFRGWFSADLGGFGWTFLHPNLTAFLCGLAGLALVPLTFHLALLLGRFQIWLARHLLVRT
ncbi:hypothetical protein GETHLI_12070 [Geothrix limicola]|uniref:Putative sensor domain-containing protein n=1 Tax=Geothrix limicola TaxID=2927978 RepID=A0ABQ5QE40_9BACT|nr:sensor domain-containing protein [Geothrix limicola]GLH72705.1 hypothetical protein GETHLI_12070 [Geothrix limicola]